MKILHQKNLAGTEIRTHDLFDRVSLCCSRSYPYGSRPPHAVSLSGPFQVASALASVLFARCLLLGIAWSTVVEHQPRDQEVMGSNPTICRAFFLFSFFLYLYLSLNDSLTDFH